MMEDGKQIERMEAYLAGELSPEEQQAFEQKLEQDPALKERLILLREVNQTFSESGDLAFFQALQAVREERNLAVRTRSLRPLYLSLAIAAGLAALIWIIWAQQETKYWPENELALALEDHYPMLLSSRSGSEREDSVLNQAIQAYQAAQYLQAATGFEQVWQADSSDSSIGLYAGLAYLYGSQPSPAKQYLLRLTTNGPPEFRGVAQYHLALSYVFLGDVQAARKAFRSIKEEPYQSRAKQWLKNLAEP